MYSLLYGIGYLAYLELSPRLGGIWIRPNDKGQNVISMASLWAMISYPFSHLSMWNIRNWDINPWPGLIISLIMDL